MKEIKRFFTALGTVCEISIMTDDSREFFTKNCLDYIQGYILDMDDRLSVFKPESEISRLNRFGSAIDIPVSEDTMCILKYAKHYGSVTGGVFDVTVGKYTERWRKNGVSGESDSGKYCSYNGPENLILKKDQTVRLKHSEIAIDLGGIAKGYAADRVREILTSSGIKNAVVNLGGTISVIGRKLDIGIRNPFYSINHKCDSVPFGSLICENETVVTSGIYEQYHGSDMSSHHILNPETGKSCMTDLLSATVISASGTEADVYATTCIILGLEKSVELSIRKKFSLILVDKKGNVYISDALKNRFVFGKDHNI